MNLALYKKEMKSSLKILLIFIAILTMYVTIILTMYDPETMESLAKFYKTMPELMASVGMKPGDTTLIGFMISYLYGFILLVFPMLFSILKAHGLVSKYIDNGSMSCLLAAGVKRSTICITQMFVLISGITILILYVLSLEYFTIQAHFADLIDWAALVRLNFGLYCLQLFIAGICFLCSCLFSDARMSLFFGAGIPFFQFILKMLANSGEQISFLKKFTFFSLFNPTGIVSGTSNLPCLLLFAGSILLFLASIVIFKNKDIHI